MRPTTFRPAAACLLCLGTLALSTSHAAVVYANNSPSGDNFQGNSIFTTTSAGNAVTGTGWHYNNVRSGGSAGIDTSYARSGDGSVRLQGSGSASRADIAYFAGGTPSFFFNNINLTGSFTATLGSFSALTAFTYDWYRDASVTGARANVAPAFRIFLDRDGNLGTTGDRGELIFEPVYNEAGGWNSPQNQWVTSTQGSTAMLHNSGLGLGTAFNINSTAYAYDATLAQWQAYLPNASILGFGVAMGSGWGGAYKGATDNIGWTLDGVSTLTNFEVKRGTVPEPGTLMLAAAALLAAGAGRRRSR